jgi:hypothetical protein
MAFRRALLQIASGVRRIFHLVPPRTISITSTGIDNPRKTTHGAAVALNNDQDCAQTYAAPLPAGKRELEPIFDLDYIGNSANEDDLLQITLNLTPAGRPGNVTLTATEGGNRIRLWTGNHKGANLNVVALPASIPAANLPANYYVEGIDRGRVVLHLSHVQDGQEVTDDLVINVVELVETQGGTSKTIYDYNADIGFQVLGAPNNYEFEWDFDGDGNYGTAAFETGKTTADVTCKYGPAEDANTVCLVENAANTRKVYAVAVRITGGLILRAKGLTHDNGGTRRGIRVALNSHRGQALPAQNNAGIQGAYPWTDLAPVTFDAPRPSEQRSWQTNYGITQRISGAGRIQYGNLVTDYAVTPYDGVGRNRRVIGVAVGPTTWNDPETKEDLDAYINHEARHLGQHVSVRDNSPVNNVWRLLDTHYGTGPGYSAFREAHAHLHEMREPTAPWRHQTHMAGIQLFRDRYNTALGLLAAIPAGPTKTAAKQLLQELYRLIPFDEMKRPEYDYYVRAPL